MVAGAGFEPARGLVMSQVPYLLATLQQARPKGFGQLQRDRSGLEGTDRVPFVMPRDQVEHDPDRLEAGWLPPPPPPRLDPRATGGKEYAGGDPMTWRRDHRGGGAD